MSAAAFVGIGISVIVNGKIVARDLLHSLIAGGIACCTAGVYFTNPVWAMVLDSACGIVQTLVKD